MLRAVRTPGVHILGHPRGRKYGSRPGISADWTQVFEEAARQRVAIEIDGDPARQDIDHDLAHLAIDAGCVFALDSDAHGAADLEFVETAIAHARLAGIPAEGPPIVRLSPPDVLTRPVCSTVSVAPSHPSRAPR
jgi:putative hydrolase